MVSFSSTKSKYVITLNEPSWSNRVAELRERVLLSLCLLPKPQRSGGAGAHTALGLMCSAHYHEAQRLECGFLGEE